MNSNSPMHPQAIADLIAFEIEQVEDDKHKKLIKDLEKLVKTMKPRSLYAYKIVINGKIGAGEKTTTETFQHKRKRRDFLISMQSFHNRITYALGVARTYTGLFGVNV